MNLNSATNEQLEAYKVKVAGILNIDPMMLDYIWIYDPESGLRERGPDRDDAHVGRGDPLEAAEGMESDPGDPHLAHGRNIQVRTGSPSGPGSSSPRRWTRVPRTRVSASSRVTIRSSGSPSSSTIPSP